MTNRATVSRPVAVIDRWIHGADENFQCPGNRTTIGRPTVAPTVLPFEAPSRRKLGVVVMVWLVVTDARGAGMAAGRAVVAVVETVVGVVEAVVVGAAGAGRTTR